MDGEDNELRRPENFVVNRKRKPEKENKRSAKKLKKQLEKIELP